MARVLAALLALGVLGVGAAPAEALTYRENRALEVAQAKWKRLPCGQIQIERVPDSPTNSGAGAVAIMPCTIQVTPYGSQLGWSFYCTLIVHEIGHLLGYAHSTDPLSVMFPTPSTYWRCHHSPRWSYAAALR